VKAFEIKLVEECCSVHGVHGVHGEMTVPDNYWLYVKQSPLDHQI